MELLFPGDLCTSSSFTPFTFPRGRDLTPADVLFFFSDFFFFYFIFKLYIIVLVLPNIKMNPPQVYMFI